MEFIGPSIFLGMAFAAAVVGVLGVVAALHFTSRREDGWLHFALYAIMISTALLTVSSGRDLSGGVDTRSIGMGFNPLTTWGQRAVTIFLLVASAERLATTFIRRVSVQRRSKAPFSSLLPVFVLFWLGTVASPALLGANPNFVHECIYSLLIGSAALLVSPREAGQAVVATRNAIMAFMMLSIVAVAVRPNMVLEMSYSQGLIPGMPRFAGLSPHAVALGIIVQIGLYCLWVRPFERRWLNQLAWGVGLLVLIFAQSKTAWVSFVVCALALLLVQHGAKIRQVIFDSTKPLLGVALALMLMLGAVGMFTVALFSDVGQGLAHFLQSSEGAQLTSLTGRDQIWAIAFEEWERYPLFGYGPGLFSESFRALIGMGNATHAHNQFVDTLARAGLVGAVSLTLYVLLLLVMSFRHARRTGGLSLALFLAIFMRGISEVPLSMNGYGYEFGVHVLLLMVLAGAMRQAAEERRAFQMTLPEMPRVR